MTAHDDDFAAALRRATTDLPASGLDLDDVLAGARLKARRSRAVAGVAAVAAVGLVGAGASAVVPRLADAPTGAPAAATCGAGPVIRFGGAHTYTTVPLAVSLVVQAGDSASRTVSTTPLDSPQPGFAFDGATTDPALRERILAAATAEGGPFERFPSKPLGAQPGTGGDLIADPGTYVAYIEGTAVEVSGWVDCADHQQFRLTHYAASDVRPLLRCGDLDPALATDAWAPFAVEHYCPKPGEPLPPAGSVTTVTPPPGTTFEFNSDEDGHVSMSTTD